MIISANTFSIWLIWLCLNMMIHKGISQYHAINDIVVVQSLSRAWLLPPHGLQHSRLPCPSLFPRVCSNSCPLSRWSHPTTSSSVIPFSSCLQYFPASGSFPVSQLFTLGGQSIGASASVLPMNIHSWLSLGFTGLIFLQSKGLSRVFSQDSLSCHPQTRWDSSPKWES